LSSSNTLFHTSFPPCPLIDGIFQKRVTFVVRLWLINWPFICLDGFCPASEPKAVETAQLVADHLGQTFQIFEGLHEHDRSNVGWMGEERFEAQLDEFFRHPDSLVMGRETASQAQLRFSQAVTSILNQHAEENIAIIARGTVITLFVTQAVELDTFGFWKRLGLPSFVVMSLPEMELANVVECFSE
jgi:broad specificity phosphatase PhoE